MKRAWGIFLISLFVVAIVMGCSKDERVVYEKEGIVVTFPDGWRKTRTVSNTEITVVSPDDSAQISLFVQKLPENMSLEEFLKMVSSRADLAGVQEQDSGPIEIGGIQGRWVTRSLQLGDKNFESIVYYAMKDHRIYALMCMAEEGAFDRWENTFDNVATGVRFED